jgi:hypothetical protein
MSFYDEKTLREMKEEVMKFIKRNNIKDNIDTHKKLNNIYDLIEDYYWFGGLVDLETGDVFTPSKGISEINKILEGITDEVYLEYELRRK